MSTAIRNCFLRFCAAFLVVLIGASVTWGNDGNPIAPPPTKSPRQTFTEFLDNTTEAYDIIQNVQAEALRAPGLFHTTEIIAEADRAEQALERAIQTLNLQDVPPASRDEVGVESVLLLKEILDRLALPSTREIPDATDVEAGLTRWEIPGTELAIAYVEEGFNIGEFLFTPETINRLETYYQEIRDLPYQEGATEDFYAFYISTPGRLLPPKWSNQLPQWSLAVYGGQTLWQWTALFLLLIIFATFAWKVRGLLRQRRLEKISSVRSAWLALLLPIVILITIQIWTSVVTSGINVTGSLRQLLTQLELGLYFIVLTWLAFITFNAIGSTIVVAPRFQDKALEMTMVRNGFRLLGVIAGATVIYTGGELLGISVAPLLASLSIGSVAIGLGLRPYVENIVGGITLFVNRPMQIGDFCEFGGVAGTVEDVGLRATLIRTPDRKLITVPNTVISSANLVNHSRRDKYAFTRVLNLVADSARKQLPVVMNELRQQLAEQPLLTDVRVSLVGLSSTAIDLELFAYVNTTDGARYRDVQADLLLAMQAVLDRLGVQLK